MSTPQTEFFQSPEIDQLAAALSQVQAALPDVPKDRWNLHLGSEYPSVESVVHTAATVLMQHGLAVTHVADGECLITTLMHTSGQWIRGRLPVRCQPMQSISQRAASIMQYMAKKEFSIELPDAIAIAEKEIGSDQDPQSQGAGMTYARRAALLAILNMAIAESENSQRPDPPGPGGDSPSGDAPTCKCGAPMVERKSDRGPFWGCSKYPSCRHTKPMDGGKAPAGDTDAGKAAQCAVCSKGKMVKNAQGWACDACGVCSPACPKCGRAMVEDGEAWACSNAPDCDGARKGERDRGKELDDDIPF